MHALALAVALLLPLLEPEQRTRFRSWFNAQRYAGVNATTTAEHQLELATGHASAEPKMVEELRVARDSLKQDFDALRAAWREAIDDVSRECSAADAVDRTREISSRVRRRGEQAVFEVQKVLRAGVVRVDS